MKQTSAVFQTVLMVSLSMVFFAACRNNDFLQEAPKTVVTSDVIHDANYPIVEMSGSPDVDILWVIDNSGSMQSYQTSVARNMDAFMNVFVTKQIHFQMGMISTDSSNAPYLGFGSKGVFDWKSPDAVNTFNRAVAELGTYGDGVEKMFSPVMKVLSQYRSFQRPGVPLALIVVSDAPEQSNETTDEFIQFYRNLRGARSDLVTYGVLGAKEFCSVATDDDWDYNPTSKYKAIIEATQGKVWSLCSDFGVSLIEIAEEVVQRIGRPKIYLNERPDLSSLKVFYQDEELKGGLKTDGGYWLYDYDLNSIVFWDLEFAPGDHESVRVVYRSL